MYGWRGRIGLIIPSSNTTMESEFWRMTPHGVSIHTARVLLKVTSEELMRMEQEAEYAAKLLTTAAIDIIVYGCTSSSLVKGPNYDEELANKLSRISMKPAIATATAIVKALKVLRARNIALATPYIDEINEKEIEFLEYHGFEIVDLKSLKIKSNIDIGRQTPETTYRLVKSLDTSRADAIFISCTNLRTIEVIDILERDLNKPVIPSNTATL